MTANAKRKPVGGNLLSNKTSPLSFLFFMSVFLLALFFRNAEIAAKAISDGLRLCVHSLIPSLFPFMVVSELFVSGDLTQKIGTWFARPMKRLFGMGGDAACAVLLGMICGFPMGTRCALTLYRQHRLTEEEFQRTLAFSHYPSAAFLINTVGCSLFSSRRFGILLYVTTLLSSVFLQLFWRGRGKKKREPTILSLSQSAHAARPTLSDALANAVSGSAQAMLSICAFVVFFSALVECLAHLCAGLELSETVSAFLFGIFELMGGVAHAARCPTPIAQYLCAFFVGWGGFSVHFQLLHFCRGEHPSLPPYFLTKLAHGMLNLLFISILLPFFGK